MAMGRVKKRGIQNKTNKLTSLFMVAHKNNDNKNTITPLSSSTIVLTLQHVTHVPKCFFYSSFRNVIPPFMLAELHILS